MKQSSRYYSEHPQKIKEANGSVARMDWSKFLETAAAPLFGSFIGASAAVAGLWLKDVLDRRRSVSDWFNQEYIEHSLHPIAETLQRWKHMIAHADSQSHISVEFQSLPHLAMVKVSTLIGSESFEQMFYMLAGAVGDISSIPKEDRPLIHWERILREIDILLALLNRLTSVLILRRVTSKKHVGRLKEDKDIIHIRTECDQHRLEWRNPEWKLFRLRPELDKLLDVISEFKQHEDPQSAMATLKQALYSLEGLPDSKARTALLTLAELLRSETEDRPSDSDCGD